MMRTTRLGQSGGFWAHAAAPARWGASSNPADRTSKQRRVGMVASLASILRYPAILAQRECRDDGCSTEKPQAAMRCGLGSRDLRMNRKQRRAMRTQGRDIGVESSQASPKAAAGRLFGQAVWHQHHGKPNEAVKLYKQVLELQPDHAEASNNLGCVLLAQGKREAASGCFERALMLVPQLFDDFDSVTAMLAAVNPALAEGMTRAASAWPQRLPLPDLVGSSGFKAICADALLRRVLESTTVRNIRSEEHTSELQSLRHLVCRL